MSKRLLGLLFISLLLLSLNTTLSITRINSQSQEPIIFVYYSRENELSKGDLTLFFQKINSSGFELKETTSLEDYGTLEGADVILILGSKNLNFIKKDILLRFLVEGGSLIIALPTESISLYNDLVLEYFSYKIGGTIKDNTSYYEKISTVIVDNSTILSNHPLTKNLSKIIVPEGLGLVYENSTNVFPLPYHAYTIIWGSNTTYIDKNNNDKKDPEEPSGNNVTCCLVIELYSGGKIVILPSVKMLSDEHLSNPRFGNKFLAYRIIDWLGGRYATIYIKDLKVSTTYIDLDNPNSRVNVSFEVVDEKNRPVENLTALVCLVRLGHVLKNFTAIRINETNYYVEISFENLTISRGIIYLMVLVYKQFYGYYWSEAVRLYLYKSPLPVTGADQILLVLGFIIPVILGIVLLVATYPEYRRNRGRLKKAYKKISKS
ncbi:MAG: hypothetical protein ACTSX9_00870 [Candidatus Njordarchaeales archaeon]